jgi:hypothetical protein
MYMAFNVGFNTIVFLVMMAIILLIAGAFLWLVVAYAANSSIRYGVRWVGEMIAIGQDRIGQVSMVHVAAGGLLVAYVEVQANASTLLLIHSSLQQV